LQAEDPKQLGVELGLDRTHGNVLPVGSPVDRVPGSGAVEEVVLATGRPDAPGEEPPVECHEQRRAVDHRGVHHLAGGPGARRGESRENTDGEEHPSPAEVSDEVARHDRVGSRAARCDAAGPGAPERPAVRAARTPTAGSLPPPPKSPPRLSGPTGSEAGPIDASAPDRGM